MLTHPKYQPGEMVFGPLYVTKDEDNYNSFCQDMGIIWWTIETFQGPMKFNLKTQGSIE